MDVKKLLTAAKLLSNKDRELSDEIVKIAQELATQQSPTQSQTEGSDTNVVMDPYNLNPNIKPYAGVEASEDANVDDHKITFDFRVPKGFSKTSLINHAMEAFNQHPDMKSNSIEVTGYSFRS